jgi:hypothetical protein
MLFRVFVINIEISSNWLTCTSQKIGTHPTITLREREPLRIKRSWGEGESNPLGIEGFWWRRPHIALGEPSRRSHSRWDGKRKLGFQGVRDPLYIAGKPNTWTCPASQIYLAHRPDMSGENCLGSSENFGNRPKTRYPTNFAVEPIEYIYIYVYICVCVVHGQVKKKQKKYMAWSN